MFRVLCLFKKWRFTPGSRGRRHAVRALLSACDPLWIDVARGPRLVSLRFFLPTWVCDRPSFREREVPALFTPSDLV